MRFGNPASRGSLASRLGQFDIENADFRRPLRPACAAERIGQQLMAEANAEKGPLEIAHPMADRALFRHQPGMLLDIPHIHRAAHHPQHVICIKRRDRLAFIEFDGIPGDPVFLEKAAEDAGMFTGNMLEDEKTHE